MTSDQDGIQCAVTGHVATVTINRPHRLNALNRAAMETLDNVFAELDADRAIRAIIVTGAGGRAFCVGSDLKDLDEDDATGRRIGFASITGVAGPLRIVNTPLVAAVCGHAVGGGFELAAACDIVVAAHDSAFSIPEGYRGFLAESPVGHRAMRHLPHHIALDLALTGRRISGDEAANWGFVNYAVPADEVLPKAREVAERIAQASPLALQAFKQALLSRADWPLEVALTSRFELIEDYQRSRDRHEGIDAFRAGRAPEWVGE